MFGSECTSVGLLEGGAGPADCEAHCLKRHNCSAFNVRMSKQGGCSLRNCPPGTPPTGSLPGFAGYAHYPVNCDAWKPPPPSPATLELRGASFSIVKESLIGPLRSYQNVTIVATDITQAFNYTVVADPSKVDFMYPFMTMFADNNSIWVAGTSAADPPQWRGEFEHNGSMTLHEDILYSILLLAEGTLPKCSSLGNFITFNDVDVGVLASDK